MAERQVARIEVRQLAGVDDPAGSGVIRAADLSGIKLGGRVQSAAVYLIESQADAAMLGRIAGELLADPVTQSATVAEGPPTHHSTAVEVHPLPGVTDPAAQSVETALRDLFGVEATVVTGRRFEFSEASAALAKTVAERLLANTVIQGVHGGVFHPTTLPKGHKHDAPVRSIELTTLDGAQLAKLSRSAHLFLSLSEMQAIQTEYRRQGREPREIELETIAQTWSEHCVHKTLKSPINYRELASGKVSPASIRAEAAGSFALAKTCAEAAGTALGARPGHTVDSSGSVNIDNLLKSTIAAATRALTDPAQPNHIDWCLSVFVDNSGVVAFDEEHAVCFKVETHNRPSAIEPYGGAATGIGGCIRDVMGTGLGAKPIACTDVFCVAPPDMPDIPKGCLPPRRVLTQVVAGVRDYGNRMGIPTVNGGVWFDERHVGNPLVFCGTVGVMPRDKVRGLVRAGDVIVALGGRTGRDGIHGATFSSAEVAHAHADEFSHAVQIGNAITEKKALDLLLAARDYPTGCLYSALTDCGAGGFSSAVGEMARELGAQVHLDRAPVKYAGLSPTEVWISEAQERMTLAVPPANVGVLRALCLEHQVEMCDLGVFGSADKSIRLYWNAEEIGRLDTHFLHEGVPMPRREAVWDPDHAAAQEPAVGDGSGVGPALLDTLRTLLAHPNIASKQWIVRQYDHEVQGTSVVKPFVGVGSGGPSDAAVISPVRGSSRALAIANGLATGLAADPYWMALAAIDECVRNLVCVGARADRIAILDNFSWPDCDDPRNLGSLVRAAEACFDGAMAYRAPFISGKDSLRNQFRTEDGRLIQIPPTLLISGFAPVDEDTRCVTMDAKCAGNALVIVGETGAAMGGSHRLRMGRGEHLPSALPQVSLTHGPLNAREVAREIASGTVRSAHDCSEGGLLLAAAEMAFSGGLGLTVDIGAVPTIRSTPKLAANPLTEAGSDGDASSPSASWCETTSFAETPSRYLLEIEEAEVAALLERLARRGVSAARIGSFISTETMSLTCRGVAMGEMSTENLRLAWESGSKGWQ